MALCDSQSAPNPGQSCTPKVMPISSITLTKNGTAIAPANPVQHTLTTFTPDPGKVLFMNPGDQLVVAMHDTADGFQVVINDLTTGETGSMTARIANSSAR
jgi:hypothetical protein